MLMQASSLAQTRGRAHARARASARAVAQTNGLTSKQTKLGPIALSHALNSELRRFPLAFYDDRCIGDLATLTTYFIGRLNIGVFRRIQIKLYETAKPN